VDVSTVILDPSEEGLELEQPGSNETGERRRARGLDELTRIASAQLQMPRQLARDALSRTRDPRSYARQVRGAASVLAELARVRSQAPATRLNTGIGRERRFALARASLADIKAVRRAANATVNDVLLACVALMLSDYLGPQAPQRAVALVPVSVRTEEQRGEGGNRIATVFADLPLRGDPIARVQEINAAMTEVKGSAQVKAGALIVGATGLAPPAVSSLTVRALSGPRMFNLVVSNIPGPQQTFYLDGVPLRELYPAVPLNPRNQALSIGIVSYDGSVFFGIQGDRDALPDLDAAAQGIERAVDRLLESI
jgi:diacylglycerol O-acyltransferase